MRLECGGDQSVNVERETAITGELLWAGCLARRLRNARLATRQTVAVEVQAFVPGVSLVPNGCNLALMLVVSLSFL